MPRALTPLEAQSQVNPPAAPKDLVPRKYNVQSILKAEVKADGKNAYTFDLRSK